MGFEEQAFTECLTSRRFEKEIIEDFEETRQAGARGTPTFLIVVAINIALNLADAYSTSSDLIEAGLVLSEAARVSQATDNVHAAVPTLCSLGQLRMAQGRLHEAAECYRQALHLAQSHAKQDRQPLATAGIAHFGLATSHYEWEGRLRVG